MKNLQKVKLFRWNILFLLIIKTTIPLSVPGVNILTVCRERFRFFLANLRTCGPIRMTKLIEGYSHVTTIAILFGLQVLRPHKNVHFSSFFTFTFFAWNWKGWMCVFQCAFVKGFQSFVLWTNCSHLFLIYLFVHLPSGYIYISI